MANAETLWGLGRALAVELVAKRPSRYATYARMISSKSLPGVEIPGKATKAASANPVLTALLII